VRHDNKECPTFSANVLDLVYVPAVLLSQKNSEGRVGKNEAYIRVIANFLFSTGMFHPSWKHLPYYGFYKVARSEIHFFSPFGIPWSL
jgi:hypothetical protein